MFDSIIFMNDVLPCVDDLLELVWQSRRQNAGITCGSDYIFHDEVVSPRFLFLPFSRPAGSADLDLFSLTQKGTTGLLRQVSIAFTRDQGE